jgi:fatty acid synthase
LKIYSINYFIGLYNETKAFIETLKQKDIFVRELESSEIPYHCPHLITSFEKMKNALKKIIPNPRMRSKLWISTSVQSKKLLNNEFKNASAEYFAYNLVNPVLFYNALKTLPSNAIVIEIGPHALFSRIITQTLGSPTYIPLSKRDQSDTNLELFLTSIGKLYELGLNPSIENLYPKIEFPVARNTQSISSLIEWDHKDKYLVEKYPEFNFRATASNMNVSVSTSLQENWYLKDHCIDGSVLYPATGYLMLAWRIMASSRGKFWKDMSVIFEEVQFRRPIFLSDDDDTKISVSYHQSTGKNFFLND